MCCKASVTKGQLQHFFLNIQVSWIFRKQLDLQDFSGVLLLRFGHIFSSSATYSAIWNSPLTYRLRQLLSIKRWKIRLALSFKTRREEKKKKTTNSSREGGFGTSFPCHQSERCGSGCWHFWVLVRYGLLSLCWAIQALQRITERLAARGPWVVSALQGNKLQFSGWDHKKKKKERKKSPASVISPELPPHRATVAKHGWLSMGLWSHNWADTSPHGARTCLPIKTNTWAGGQQQL